MNISKDNGEPFTDHNDSGPKNLPCPCDLDDDDMVGTLDAGAVEAAFGLDPSNPLYAKFDIDMDGVIGTLDLGAVYASFGPCPS